MQSDQKIGLCLLIGLLGFAAALGVGRREQPLPVTSPQAELAALSEIAPVEDELLPVSEVAAEPVLDEPEPLPEIDPVSLVPARAADIDDDLSVPADVSTLEVSDRREPSRRLEVTTNVRPPRMTNARRDAPPMASPEPRRPRLRSYTVRSGDTLSGIASRELGDVGRYLELFEVNRDTLGHPDALRVGQILKLPGDDGALQVAELPGTSAIR